ncbi:DUF397 domain-containing protein [Amycolatopsis cihanbeyliensis]|uniref:DUF397 domain-containing protein n=1 Tax=Amycolatopsis cihanbeyliensis TaxID=1128664 RepID=UPI00114FBBF3|nr:DUF397 domain-containing protein [Amycolatopsis cihanbeyliensis]
MHPAVDRAHREGGGTRGNNPLSWRSSSHSTANGGDCVEVGWREHRTGVRDFKSPTPAPSGSPPPAWHAFLSTLR